MKNNPRMRSGFTLVELLVVISIIATLAGVGVPVIINQQKKGARAEAISNIKQIGMAMFSFDQDYNGYPSKASSADVHTNNPDSTTTLSTTPTTSNDFFVQLIVGGYIDGEKQFYAKSTYTKKADGVITSTKALDAGECGFSYVMGKGDDPLSSSGNSGQALLLAAAYRDSGGAVSSTGACELDVYDKKAIVFRIDNSATAESIRPSDKMVLIGGGKTLLQGADQDSVWGATLTPTLKVPLPKK